MSDLITRTAKLLPRTKRIKPVPGFATAYHYEAEGDESQQLGNLYVVIEVLTNPKPAEAVADLVIETMGNSYYNVQLNDETPALARFEAAVKSTNQALADYTNAGNASWVGRISAVIAVVVGSELHITQTGSAEAFLFRGNVTSHVTTDLQDKGPHRPITTFAHIASGDLEVHDRIVIATPALFHKVQRPALKTLVNDNTASGAVQKLSELIGNQDDADRVAAIVIELTTSELLALQTRTSEPEAVEIGQADKPLEVAKAIASPAVRTIVNTSKQVGLKAAEQTKTTVAPKLKSIGIGVAGAIRSRLRTNRGRQQLGLAAVVAVVALASLGFWNNTKASATKQIQRYGSIYQQYTHAQDQLNQGDKTAARATLTQAAGDLSALGKSVNGTTFASQLTRYPHPEADPASIPKLSADISALIDQIDGVVTVQTNLLTDFSTLKAKPTQLELLGRKLVMIDSLNGSSIYAYDLDAKTLATVATAPKGLGHVVAVTPNADNSGLYILTDQPNVWLFKIFDGSLTQEAISFGNWPKGRAIASYNGNLYVLAADSSQLYKFTPTAGGFGAPTNYFKDNSVVSGATALAIDGSIYLQGGPNGLRQFILAKPTASLATIPQTLQNAIELRSVDTGNELISLDGTSHRLGIYLVTASAISFDKQLVIRDAANVYAMTADAKATTLYAVIDGKLVTASLPK